MWGVIGRDCSVSVTFGCAGGLGVGVGLVCCARGRRERGSQTSCSTGMHGGDVVSVRASFSQLKCQDPGYCVGFSEVESGAGRHYGEVLCCRNGMLRSGWKLAEQPRRRPICYFSFPSLIASVQSNEARRKRYHSTRRHRLPRHTVDQNECRCRIYDYCTWVEASCRYSDALKAATFSLGIQC